MLLLSKAGYQRERMLVDTHVYWKKGKETGVWGSRTVGSPWVLETPKGLSNGPEGAQLLLHLSPHRHPRATVAPPFPSMPCRKLLSVSSDVIKMMDSRAITAGAVWAERRMFITYMGGVQRHSAAHAYPPQSRGTSCFRGALSQAWFRRRGGEH